MEHTWAKIKSWISSWKTTNFGNGSYNNRGGVLRTYGVIDLDRKGRNNFDIRHISGDIDLEDISYEFILIIYEDSTSGNSIAPEITYSLNGSVKVNIWQMEFRSNYSASWRWKQTVQGEGEHTYELPRIKDGNITLVLFLSMFNN